MKLILQQKVLSLKERFEVMNEEGEVIFEVVGKLISLGHKLTINDAEGEEVAHIHQKVVSLTPKYDIEIKGCKDMTLHGHLTLLKPHYTLKAHDGEWDIRGNFLEHNYEMTSGGQVVATVVKKWLSWGDCYQIEVADDADALKALSVMLAVDCVIADTNHAQSGTIAHSTTLNN